MGVEVVAEFRVQGRKSSEGDGRTAADLEKEIADLQEKAERETRDLLEKEDSRTWA